MRCTIFFLYLNMIWEKWAQYRTIFFLSSSIVVHFLLLFYFYSLLFLYFSFLVFIFFLISVCQSKLITDNLPPQLHHPSVHHSPNFITSICEYIFRICRVSLSCILYVSAYPCNIGWLLLVGRQLQTPRPRVLLHNLFSDITLQIVFNTTCSSIINYQILFADYLISRMSKNKYWTWAIYV